MGRLKAKLFQLLNLEDKADEATVLEVVPTEKPAEDTLVVVDYNDVPIYQATPDDFKRWQCFGHYTKLWSFLIWHGQNFRNRISDYRDFNVGYDRKNHRAIFQLDEEGHYCQIQFDDEDEAPVDNTQAFSVLALLTDIETELAKSSKKTFRIKIISPALTLS